MGETISSSSSSSSGSSGSSSNSQSAAAAQTTQSAQKSQTSQISQQSMSIDSILGQNAAKETASDIISAIVSGLKPADPKNYLLAEKLQKEGKKPELYKRELDEGKQLKQESTKTKYVEADVFTTSKKCQGTVTPIDPNSSKPVKMSDTTQVLMAMSKYSTDSMAFNAGFFTSLFWKLLTQMYSNVTEKMRLPCAEVAYVCG